MEQKTYLQPIVDCIVNLDFGNICDASQKAIDAGIDPRTIIVEAMAPAMEEVGIKFETKEYFLSELVVAAEVMKEGMSVVTPYIKGSDASTPKCIVVATVQGDYHDIGKNIVVALLEAQGFKVIDLGVDIPAAQIVEAVKENDAMVVGLSALLSSTILNMGGVIEALKAAGLRDKVKVVLGGAPVTPEFGEQVGADIAGLNAVETTNKCVEWAKEVK